MRHLRRALLLLALCVAAPPARAEVPVDLFEDLDYAGSGDPQQRLDLGVPAGHTNRLPVLVFIHGGAWQGGSRQQGRGWLAPFVKSGRYAGASVEYRFSQHATWPAQIQDCKAAIRWLRGHADTYGLDPDRIGVWGDSAGGHLVAMLGTAGDVPSLEGTIGAFTGLSSRVSCVVDYYGPSDFMAMVQVTNAYRHGERDAPVARLLGGLVSERLDAARSASPVTWASADDPPFLIAHGTKDNIVPISQSETLVKALTDAKVAVPPRFIRMIDAGHGFGSAELNRRITQFFDRCLYGADETISVEPIRP